MTRSELSDQMTKMDQDDRVLFQEKNFAYASSEDPYENFRNYAAIGLSVRDGILSRLIDKFSRLKNHHLGKIAHENILDDIQDMRVYLRMLQALVQEELNNCDDYQGEVSTKDKPKDADPEEPEELKVNPSSLGNTKINTLKENPDASNSS